MQGITLPDRQPNYPAACMVGLVASFHAALLLAITLPVHAPAGTAASEETIVGYAVLPPRILFYAPDRTRVGEVRPVPLPGEEPASPLPRTPPKGLSLPAPSEALSISFSVRPRPLELWIHVSATGSAREVRVVQSSGFHELDEMAIANAMKHWRFTPAHEGRSAVESAVLVSVEFGTWDGRPIAF
ncbi:TonB family protein [Luteimonas aquatica]|uniref:TonB family protein n=1 Tax=Luteimonas aquatica TaxID=450364 RepID=UPI001F5A32FE|nr:TonB family protein [Luteimonas aquatica]